jgi:hypothetical protein
MTDTSTVLVERDGPVTIISINRPHCRNAVDGATARKLFDALLAFDADAQASVAVFTGTGGTFCAGADLKAVASGDPNKKREVGGHHSIAPMGRWQRTSRASRKPACAPTGCRRSGNGICRRKKRSPTKCAAGSRSSPPAKRCPARRALRPASAATACSTGAK